MHNRREVREGRLHLTFVRVKFGGTKTMKLSLSRLHLPVFLSVNRIWRVFYCDQSFNLLCNFFGAVGKLYGALRKLWKNAKSEFNPTLSGQIQVSSPVSSIKVRIFLSWNLNWPVWTNVSVDILLRIQKHPLIKESKTYWKLELYLSSALLSSFASLAPKKIGWPFEFY